MNATEKQASFTKQNKSSSAVNIKNAKPVNPNSQRFMQVYDKGKVYIIWPFNPIQSTLLPAGELDRMN